MTMTDDLLSDEQQLCAPQSKILTHKVSQRKEVDARGAADFWMGELETRHFTFHAFGATEASCRDAMKRALVAHFRQVKAQSTSPHVEALSDSFLRDANFWRVGLGEGFRDRTCITRV